MDSESTAAVNRGFRRGLTIGSAKDGTVTTFIPAPFSEGQAANARPWGESVAVDDDGNIYTGMNGTKGVERHAIVFHGQEAHSGSTPMKSRKDALAAAARLSLEIRAIAGKHADAVCTIGSLKTFPGIATAVSCA